ncbi:hypothetical protein CVIRNUC_001434 [Coccomyxa viridis]|uniref:Uncharacterized protein n=1 Tax=Coccomyxa viridis TaxID=1274662 RepID=A0AAV1HWM2_9CHLO|nr:hypothetical protein CVIRNUC_001434 [Coccomyxa viridis]
MSPRPVRTAEWALLHGNCRTDEEKRLGLRPGFEVLKQRADEYFPLRDDHEKPHLRWAAGYPEGTVRPGRPKRETYPGYTRYQERIQADVDGMRFWSTMHMLKTHNHCLPPEQQEIFKSSREVKSPPIKDIRATQSAAYRLDEDRRLAEAFKHLQSSTGQEPAVGDASDVEAVAQGSQLATGEKQTAAAAVDSQGGAVERRRAGKTSPGSTKRRRTAASKDDEAHPVRGVSAPVQHGAVLIKVEASEAASDGMLRRPHTGRVNQATSQPPATVTAAAPGQAADGPVRGKAAAPAPADSLATHCSASLPGSATSHASETLLLRSDSPAVRTPAQKKGPLPGAHGWSGSGPAGGSTDAQQPASASEDAAGPVPPVTAAASEAEARAAGDTAWGAATAALAELRGLLQQREAECRQVAAQNIALQMKNEELHDALAAVRQGAEEDTALLRFMDSSIATMHARLSNCKRARPSA